MASTSSSSTPTTTTTTTTTTPTIALSTSVDVAGGTLPSSVVRVLSQASVAGQEGAVQPLRHYYGRVLDGYRAAMLHIYEEDTTADRVGRAASTYQPEYDIFMTIVIQASLIQPTAVHELMSSYPQYEAEARAATATPKVIKPTKTINAKPAAATKSDTVATTPLPSPSPSPPSAPVATATPATATTTGATTAVVTNDINKK
jgi:hypothetical protein